MGLLLKLGIQQNLMDLFLKAWFGSTDGLKLGTNEVTKLGIFDQKVGGTTLGVVVGFPLGTSVGSDLGYVEIYTDGYVDGKFGGLLYQCMDLSSEQMKVLK